MSQAGSIQVVSLGGCQFDPSRGLLLRDGAPVTLRAKAFALLAHLAAHAGQVVSKSDLMTAVWPDVFVTEDSLTQAVRELRKALADEDQAIVRTVPKRGYLLSPSDLTQEASPSSVPMVAVLRFTNDGEAADAALIDGFVEDVVNALSRFRTVGVLARNSSFAFGSGDAVDWRDVGRRIGVTYLVRGRMSLRAETARVAVNLIDAESSAVLWSETFSASGQGVFEIQEEIALRLVNRLVTRLDDARLVRARPKPPASLAAYELLLKGLTRLRGYGADDNQAARDLFEAAIAKDREYALAHAYLACADLIIGGYGATPATILAEILQRARFAVSLAPEEPRCHRVLAQTLLCARSFEAAERHLRRSFDLNPHDADTMAQMGYLLTIRGRPFEALSWLDKAVRINPVHPDWYHYDRAMALYAAGDYERAAISLSMLPMTSPSRLTRLAATHAQLGNLEAARHHLEEARRIAPNFSPLEFARHGVAFERQPDAEHLAQGVTKALEAWKTAEPPTGRH